MAMNVGKEIAALKRMTVTELRKKHVEVFGEPTRSGHKDYLVKRIAWRICRGPADYAWVGFTSGTCLGRGPCDDLEYCGGTRYHPGLSGTEEGRMLLLSSTAVLRLVDSMAILLSQAYQLARARLASAGSPILRLLVQRDQETTEVDLLRKHEITPRPVASRDRAVV